MSNVKRPDWAKNGIQRFCKMDKERSYAFRGVLHKHGFTMQEMSLALELNENSISARANKGCWFSQGEYRKIKEVLDVSDEELSNCFDFSKEGMEMIQRSGNGYKLDFKVNNETHLAYGKSEIECRQNAEKRKQELESKAEETEESVKIVVSKDDAMLLSFYLLKGIKEGKPTGEDKTTLTSIYMRIATALI